MNHEGNEKQAYIEHMVRVYKQAWMIIIVIWEMLPSASSSFSDRYGLWSFSWPANIYNLTTYNYSRPAIQIRSEPRIPVWNLVLLADLCRDKPQAKHHLMPFESSFILPPRTGFTIPSATTLRASKQLIHICVLLDSRYYSLGFSFGALRPDRLHQANAWFPDLALHPRMPLSYYGRLNLKVLVSLMFQSKAMVSSDLIIIMHDISLDRIHMPFLHFSLNSLHVLYVYTLTTNKASAS